MIHDLIQKNVVNLDANETVFFRRQLEYQKAQAYDVKYPTLTATTAFPVSTEAGPGAETIVYDQFDSVGVMKFIADYADDLPRSDVKGQQFSIIIQSLGGSYGWSIQEIRNAQFANRNLQGMRAMAARRSNDQMANRIGWFADGTAQWAGLRGILYDANITKSAAPTGTWSTATTDQIIADVNFTINNVPIITNGSEKIDTLLLPIDQYSRISSTPRSVTSDTTILSFLQGVHPGVTFDQIPELNNVTPNPRTGTGSADVMLAYTRNPMNLTYEIPVIFEQFPAQERNLSFVVPTHSRNAGFNIYYPLSVHLVDGI